MDSLDAHKVKSGLISFDVMPIMQQSTLIEWAGKTDEEICGFIIDDWELYPITNVHTWPRWSFKFDNNEMLGILGSPDFNVIGMYHSHTNGRIEPSENDIEYAPKNLRYWIIAQGQVIEWKFEDGRAIRVG